MSKAWLTETKGIFKLAVQVSPNGKKNEILSETPEALRIRLQAPPIDGKANETLVRFIADKCNISKSNVEITHGLSSRKKLLKITAPSLSLEEIEKIFSIK